MPDISRYLKKAKQMDAENGVVYTATPPTSANRSTYTPYQSGPISISRASPQYGQTNCGPICNDKKRFPHSLHS